MIEPREAALWRYITYCSNHTEIPAHQLCGVCLRVLCKGCSIKIEERPEAIVCSEACRLNYVDNLQIHEKAKMLYGIGTYAKLSSWSPSFVIMFIMGAILISLGFSLWYITGHYDNSIFPLVLGALFCLISLAERHRRKKFGLKL